MHPLLIAQLLTLLAVANGTPIIVEKLLGKFLAFPIDGGATLADGKPVFGSSKTLRGLALSILATTGFAPLIGLNWRIGALVAATAMLGDLLSSFLKRRMGLAPSCQAIGLDQIPESLASPVGVLVFPASDHCRCGRCHGHLFRRRAVAVAGAVQIGDSQPPLLNSANRATRQTNRRAIQPPLPRLAKAN